MTEPLVDLSKHTGVTQLLSVLQDGHDSCFIEQVRFNEARTELQKLVDDACKVEMEFADFRQKSAEKASADVANIWSELHELRVVHDAFVEGDKVKDKTIARLTKERDTALAELDRANAHHDEHHAREDSFSTRYNENCKLLGDVTDALYDAFKLLDMKTTPPTTVEMVRELMGIAREAKRLREEITTLSRNNTMFATEIQEAFNLAGRRLSGLGIVPEGKTLTERVQVLFDLARDHGDNRKVVEEKNAILQKERDEAVSVVDKMKEKYETKLTTAGNRISEFYGVTRNLLALVKTKITVAEAFSAVTDAEKLLAKKSVSL